MKVETLKRKMKIPLGIARKLLELKEGIKVPYSRLKHAVVDTMIDNGILSKQLIGRNKAMIYLSEPGSMASHLLNHYGISDLEKYILLLGNEESSRAEAIEAASDSKASKVRTFKGFLVASYTQIDNTYKGSYYSLNQPEGIFTFIYDYEDFTPGENVTIIGIENPEVFRNIQKCASLFKMTDLLFVCRYPQTKDLIRWLRMIPNNYIHFGDFDYAGINIYMNEYKKHLNDRATFFLPEGIEYLIESKGNRQNYQHQTLCVDPAVIHEPAIHKLLQFIAKHKKGLEQEIYVL